MKEISKQYDFSKEDEIYKLWEDSGFFSLNNLDSKETYCNVLPPPNANGELHVGHASGYTVMDIFGRWQRMRGKKVLLLPGKDHAGIQTQVVYERKLKEKGISRQDLGREKFYKEVYDFCIGRADYMRSQEKKIGISADWSREKFTLGEDVLKIALETFVKMYEDGMVRRGKRIINWCPRCTTALADVETLHKETDGKLYYIKYPIEDLSAKGGSQTNFITVATTRPETMLGDTAVAVNSKDEKYKDLVGKNVILPLMERRIPIISDRRVEMGFGTGAVKITPAHDPLDWRMGKDHKLLEIQVINEKAEITSEGGKYAGQKVLEARENVLKDLESLGLLEKTEDAKINITICERCKTTIEPLISEQWFVNVDAEKFSLKKRAIEAIEKGEIEIYPENFKKILIQWLTNLEDWCISRQIWWGPRIPVWYKNNKNTEITYFVHGTTTDNENDIATGWLPGELSELGKQQSKNLGELVGNQKFDIVFCSDLKRAVDSAELVFGGKYEIKTDERLREANYGDYNGKPHTFKKEMNNYVNNAFSNGESYKDVEERMKDFLKEISNKYPEKKIAIVAHQAPQLALEVILNDKTWKEAIEEDWRNEKAWQPGWKYSLKKEIYVGLEKPKGEGWAQDEDTFDTWFTSGQWPYTTLGYPDGKDCKAYYPTDMMVTGRDLIFLWCSRMIMLGLYRTGQVPFKKVYFTGLVRDKEGRKFSKSSGNGIDPLVVIEKFGADAFRLSSVINNSPGLDSKLYEEKIESYRNFITKLWNIFRYSATSDENFQLVEKLEKSEIKSLSDKWILSKLEKLIGEFNKDLENCQLSMAGDKLKDFTWNDLADWYLEINKIEKNSKVLGYVLDKILKIWHPFIPFVTENIYQHFDSNKLLMVAKWPESEKELIDEKAEKEFGELQEAITKIRNMRSNYHIEPAKIISAYGENIENIENIEIIEKLARIKISSGKAEARAVKISSGDIKLELDLAGLFDAEKEKTRLQKEIGNLQSAISRTESLLKNKKFMESAPKEIVAENKSRLEEYKNKLGQQKELLKNL